MFYYLELTQSIDLEPRYFGPKLKETVRNTIVQKMEGTCGKHGYIVAVVQVVDVSEGKVRQDGSGLASFKVTFAAVAFRPFKGEVLDCIVESVNKMGFFARAGPLQVFVSGHLMPEEYEYDTSGEPAFVSTDQSLRIQEHTEVRLRLQGVRIEQTEMKAIGSIKEQHLGPLGTV